MATHGAELTEAADHAAALTSSMRQALPGRFRYCARCAKVWLVTRSGECSGNCQRHDQLHADEDG